MNTEAKSDSDVVAQFRQAMERAGIVTQAEIIADGKLHRFHIDGDRPGRKNGWYVLHAGVIPYGNFGSWKLGTKETWKGRPPKGLSKEEREAANRRIAETEAGCRTEREKQEGKARAQAEYIWKHTADAPEDHPYPRKKRVKPYGIKLYKGCLVVPVRDVEGRLHSLQLISPSGEKRFLSGGRTSGCCVGIGLPRDRIYVAEGFATAATIHQVTSEAVIVAFSAGNLRPVAEALRKKYPKTELVIAADNDQWTEGNPGLSQAKEAAKAVKGKVAVPFFRDISTRPTDFNDLFRLEGAESVLRRLEQACKPALAGPGPGIRASEVKPEKVRWLWLNHIPLGEVAILDGDPGVGKSAIALDLAARVTQGWRMPDSSDAQPRPRGVLIVSLEDSPSHTIRPRLEAAGAELEQVQIINAIPMPDGARRLPSIPEDLPEIEKTIREVNAALVIIDPFIGCLTAETNSWKDQDVRRAIAPLEQLAERTGVAVLAIRHLNKTSGGNPLYRGGGSIALIAGARTGLLAARDPDDPNLRVLAMTKSNLGPEQPSLRYRLEPSGDTIRVVWEGESPHRAVNLLVDTEGEEGRGKTERAMEFFRVELADGPVLSTPIMAKGKKLGFADRTLDRAREKLGVKAYPVREGKERSWYLRLPENAKQPSKDANIENLASLDQKSETKGVSSVVSPKDAKSGILASLPPGLASLEAGPNPPPPPQPAPTPAPEPAQSSGSKREEPL